MPCPPCESLRVERRVETHGQLRQVIRKGQSELANGVLTAIRAGDAQPDRLLFSAVGDTDWPDYMEYRFRCTRCGTVFLLTAETYHGRGGRWQVEPSSERGAA